MCPLPCISFHVPLSMCPLPCISFHVPLSMCPLAPLRHGAVPMLCQAAPCSVMLWTVLCFVLCVCCGGESVVTCRASRVRLSSVLCGVSFSFVLFHSFTLSISLSLSFVSLSLFLSLSRLFSPFICRPACTRQHPSVACPPRAHHHTPVHGVPQTDGSPMRRMAHSRGC